MNIHPEHRVSDFVCAGCRGASLRSRLPALLALDDAALLASLLDELSQ